MQLTQEATQAEKVAYGKLFQEVHQLAKDVEKSIKEIQGEQSEKLIEVYALFSFFAFHQGQGDVVMNY